MTDTPTETTHTDEPVDLEAADDETPTPAETSEPGADDDHPPPHNREEQYRKRARAAEVELTLARARVSEMNRAEAERLAVQWMADASDLWASGVALDDVLGDDGLIDSGKIDAAVGDLLHRKPHLAKRGPVTPSASSVRGDGKPPGAQTAPSLEQAFTPGQS